jgi:hypothetical protein
VVQAKHQHNRNQAKERLNRFRRSKGIVVRTLAPRSPAAVSARPPLPAVVFAQAVSFRQLICWRNKPPLLSLVAIARNAVYSWHRRDRALLVRRLLRPFVNELPPPPPNEGVTKCLVVTGFGYPGWREAVGILHAGFLLYPGQRC